MTVAIDGDLESLRAVDSADVYKAARPAATLTRTADGVVFRYREDWVDRRDIPVATTLPVGRDPVVRAGGALPAYFAGLLPEGRRLGALRRAVKTSADDELSLLLAVGSDAIGDVQVIPSGSDPLQVPPRVAIEQIEQISFAELLEELGIQAQRSALPGVQDKTSAAMINLPVAQAGESHILKLNPVAAYPHLVEDEAFFLRAAQLSGFPVPVHRLVADREGSAGLLIQRFDRVTIDGKPRALAVEDGCQAAGRPPADKYLLGADRTFAPLVAVCDAPALAARALVSRLAFAYLTANGDAHAKNFSVLQEVDGEWRVAPIYDVPCSYVYGDRTMALAIGRRVGSDFGAADFIALGGRLGVPERAVRTALTDLTDRADRWLGDLDSLPFDRGRIGKLRRTIGYRRKRLTPGR